MTQSYIVRVSYHVKQRDSLDIEANNVDGAIKIAHNRLLNDTFKSSTGFVSRPLGHSDRPVNIKIEQVVSQDGDDIITLDNTAKFLPNDYYSFPYLYTVEMKHIHDGLEMLRLAEPSQVIDELIRNIERQIKYVRTSEL